MTLNNMMVWLKSSGCGATYLLPLFWPGLVVHVKAYVSNRYFKIIYINNIYLELLLLLFTKDYCYKLLGNI